ncbi:MAG: hypothetical protein ACI9FN_001286 [Saprospiraceae bacterium]|jgi:hypothetical protein
MKRLSNLTNQGSSVHCTFFYTIPFFAQSDNHQPNIVLLVTEDNSKHFLRLYEEGGVPTPNIEALANNGNVFNHAFSNARVCSVAQIEMEI